MSVEQENKELDLIDILKVFGNWIGKGFQSIGSFFVWVLKFSIKNWSILVVSVAIGVALSFYFSQPKFSKYDGVIVMENNLGSSAEFVTAIQSLASSLDPYAANALFSTRFGISSELGQKVLKLEPFYIYSNEKQGLYNVIDENKQFVDLKPIQNKFAVLIKTNDRTAFALLKNALRTYFDTDVYFKAANNARMVSLYAQKLALTKEIEGLDSLKNLEYFGSNSKSKNLKMEGALLIGETNTQLYHTNILEMSDQLQEIKNEIMLRNNVLTVSSDFTIQPPHNGRVKYGLLFAAGFFVLGFLIALAVRYGKNVKAFVNKE